MDYLDEAEWIIKGQVVPRFKYIWSVVVQDEVPDFTVLVWGSVVEGNQEPDDLDIIIAYECGDTINEESKESIVGWLTDDVYADLFGEIDPLIIPVTEVNSLLDNSRCSQVYNVRQERLMDDDEVSEKSLL